jgi:hypothetical protein
MVPVVNSLVLIYLYPIFLRIVRWKNTFLICISQVKGCSEAKMKMRTAKKGLCKEKNQYHFRMRNWIIQNDKSSLKIYQLWDFKEFPCKISKCLMAKMPRQVLRYFYVLKKQVLAFSNYTGHYQTLNPRWLWAEARP